MSRVDEIVNDFVKTNKKLSIIASVTIGALIISLIFNVKQYNDYRQYKHNAEIRYHELEVEYNIQCDDIERALRVIESYQDTCNRYEYCVNELETMVIELMDYLKMLR